MVVITADTDWAPQFVIDDTLALFRNCGVTITLFSTCKYELTESKDLEIGLHPNFMSDSTQGCGEHEIIGNLKNIYPNANSIRTHRLYWHGGLPNLFDSFDIKLDSSIILPFHPNLIVTNTGSLQRIPFWWGDNMHIINELPFNDLNSLKLEENGIKIFNFHPIHLYLNTRSLTEYRDIMSNYKNLKLIPEKELRKKRNSELGIRDFLVTLSSYCKQKKQGTHKMSELMICS